jgi:hypothetical protein
MTAVVYYKGRSLAAARLQDASIEERARAAYAAYQSGEVYLLQRVIARERNSAGLATATYEYLAIERARRGNR